MPVPVNAPQLTMTKTASASPFVVGTPASYTLTVTEHRHGGDDGGHHDHRHHPAGLTIGALPAGCTAVGQTVTCTIASGLAREREHQLHHPDHADDQRSERHQHRHRQRRRRPDLSGDPRCDDTVLVPLTGPDLTVVKTHSGTFVRGQPGGIYTLTVANIGTAATFGLVTVVDTLPFGLTATAISGSGWSCLLATLTCTRSDVLAAGASYPAITIAVSVDVGAPDTLLNTVVVSGGGDDTPGNNTDDDPVTVINGGPVAPLIPVPVDSRFALLLLAFAVWGLAFARRRRFV